MRQQKNDSHQVFRPQRQLADTTKTTIIIILIGLVFILRPGLTYGEQIAVSVLVIKSESRPYLIREGREIASFKVAFGSNPKGHKQEQGDE
jgi:hypothetical protein